MNFEQIIAEIDSQIAKLQQARTLLSEGTAATTRPTPAKRGPKPRGTAAAAPAKKAKKARRKLSPEGRKRIQEAMARRWAAYRKQPAS